MTFAYSRIIIKYRVVVLPLRFTPVYPALLLKCFEVAGHHVSVSSQVFRKGVYTRKASARAVMVCKRRQDVLFSRGEVIHAQDAQHTVPGWLIIGFTFVKIVLLHIRCPGCAAALEPSTRRTNESPAIAGFSLCGKWWFWRVSGQLSIYDAGIRLRHQL